MESDVAYLSRRAVEARIAASKAGNSGTRTAHLEMAERCDDLVRAIAAHQRYLGLLQVSGPTGERLTLDSLPPPTTTHWVARRKGTVVAAVAGGLLTSAEACRRYSLTPEEFSSWQRAFERSGLTGLQVTKIQQSRTE